MNVPSTTPSFQDDRYPVNVCLQSTFAQPFILKTIGRFFLCAGTIIVSGYLSGMNELVKKNARVVWVSSIPRQYQING